MKNCGARAHAMAAAKELPKTMVRLCERAPNLEVRDKTMELVQEWALHLRRNPEFGQAYADLRSRGFRFPEPSRAPAASATRSQPGYHWSTDDHISDADRAAIAQALAESEAEAREVERLEAEAEVQQRLQGAAPPHRIYPGNIPLGQPVRAPPHLSHGVPDTFVAHVAGVDSELQRALRESEASAAAERAMREGAARPTSTTRYTPADVEKLKGDIAVARHSLDTFASVLDACIAARPMAPSDVARELSEQCRAMHPRLIELISNAEDSLLASAIELNDALTAQMERYDTLVRASKGDVSAAASIAPRSQAPPTAPQKFTTESLLSELDDAIKSPSGPASTSTTANPFGDFVASQAVATSYPVPVSGPVSGPASGPALMSPNPFMAGPSMASTRGSGPSSTPVMRTNPAYGFGDEFYSSQSVIPSQLSPQVSTPPRSPQTMQRRGPPPRSPVSDPFADLSAVAASRARRDDVDDSLAKI